MDLLCNVPFVCVLLPLIAGIACAVLPRRGAKLLCFLTVLVLTAANAFSFFRFFSGAGPFTYPMGHFPGPWGNELRSGLLESTLALCLCLTAFLSLWAGSGKAGVHIPRGKQGLYYSVVCLAAASVNALIYTNDIFTGYVFIEISTIAAGALILSRQDGQCLSGCARYLVMNLVGSGLCLMGIAMLYGQTGHLNIDSLRLSLRPLAQSHPLPLSLRTVIVLLTVGLGIKSGLFPFHSWIPDAYSYSTPASGALLSSFISKGYIFLLVKIVVRVFGLDMIRSSGICPVIFFFGAAGIIMGSVSATRQSDIRRMVAFSSVAQIGYIYMGIGMCTRESMIAALFHMAVHSFAKSMLFSSAASLIASSGDRAQMDSLAGSGRRNVPAGIAFTIGAMSLTGVPLLGGFLSKIYLSQAAIAIDTFHAVAVLLTLALSTFLQTVYFLHAVVNIYRPRDKNVHAEKQSVLSGAALCVMALMNILLGTASVPLYRALVSGFLRF